ncbi:hypothetical protein CAPTEDRAFT_229101 [Capitella teleta]|uniref:mRNA-decapping enzyme 2 n=1 Tax=Capitella teleta TaxID=283909 RepID=R7U899_CAPTE|nr:hypothetical protein CAPTEDRAFT_229101 [Capitella teleta]|eukprot:ELU02605.1 hypothetical protein CAPTEDRAFT_229101 [Capitella teleta]
METPIVNRIVSSTGYKIPDDVLVDLCSRFVINIPEEERQDLIRIFFQIELAHWFYLDFYCQERDELKPSLFKNCPNLIPHSNDVDTILESWREYKMMVPTYGAILLDSSYKQCLLVQGFWSRSSWGFPKGKVNEGEPQHTCAIREVLEETGFDISDLIDLNEYIDFKMHEQLTRLYLVPNVPLDTQFQPRTRNEIKRLEWFTVNKLPLHKKDPVCKQELGLNPNAFFMVIPFIRHLRKWISQQQKGRSKETAAEDSEDNQKVPRDTRAKLFTKQRTKDDASPAQRKASFSQRTKDKPQQITKRDVNAANPTAEFAGERPRMLKGRSLRKGVPAWNNFHLNVDDIMTAMFPSYVPPS